MNLKDIDLDLSVKRGVVTAKLDSPNIKLDLTIDVAKESTDEGKPSLLMQQLATVLFNTAQGLVQAGNLGKTDDDDDDGGDGGDEDEAEPPARKDATQ